MTRPSRSFYTMARQPGVLSFLKGTMTLSRAHVLSSAAALLLIAPSFLTSSAIAQDSSKQPDNSSQNKNQGKTADSHFDPKADRLMTANIRKAIIADKGLSMYAHNVKIITHAGAVTLKGPVKSDDEKQKVMTDAASVVSQDKITNQITVKQ